jgi:hypothetical protein
MVAEMERRFIRERQPGRLAVHCFTTEKTSGYNKRARGDRRREVEAGDR